MSAVLPISAERNWADYVVLRLFRRWAVCRSSHEPELPSLVSLAGEIGASPHAAVAVASVFQVTEAHLGRTLIAECCCSRDTSADERAILMLLRTSEGIGPIATSRIVPHGLPGVLAWACASARLALGDAFPRPEQRQSTIARTAAEPSQCPFFRPPARFV